MKFNVQSITYKQSNIRFLTGYKSLCWYNMTDIAKANDKFLYDWQRLNSTIEYVEELKKVLKSEVEIHNSDISTPDELIGIWGVKYLALDLAKFCDTEFYVWASINFN